MLTSSWEGNHGNEGIDDYFIGGNDLELLLGAWKKELRQVFFESFGSIWVMAVVIKSHRKIIGISQEFFGFSRAVKDITPESWKWNIVLPRKQLFWREVSYFPLKLDCYVEGRGRISRLVLVDISIHIAYHICIYIYSTIISFILPTPPFLKGKFPILGACCAGWTCLSLAGISLHKSDQFLKAVNKLAKVLAFFRSLLSLWKKGRMFTIFKIPYTNESHFRLEIFMCFFW